MGGFKDAIDGGGYGGSGDSFSNLSHQDYKKAGGEDTGKTSFWDRLTSDRLDDPSSASMTDTRSNEEKIQALQAWSEENQRRDSQRAARIDGDGGNGGGGDDVTSPADMYAENKRRYDEFKAKQKADANRASGMDRARRMYEQQNMGAGSPPPQMQGLGQFRNPFMPRRPIYYPQRQQTQPFQGSGYRGDGYNMGRVAIDPPPNMMAPGTGGSGVQRDVNQPSAARARELMMAGDTAAAMRMLKASTGMEDTSLSSQDALNYYKNSGDQAGTQNILRSSVGLPQEQVARQGNENQRSVGAILQQDGSIDNTAMMQQRRGYQPAVMPPYNGRMPMPQPMPQNQATSPAFRYAGQNYGRLGGQQRMYDRPMEMMSQRERQGVNRIYDDMRTIRPMSQPSPFYSRQGGQQQGIAQLLQNALANKGGGRTAPQPQMPRYQTMPYQRGRGGLPSIGGKGAGRTTPQRSMRGFGGDPRFGGMY